MYLSSAEPAEILKQTVEMAALCAKKNSGEAKFEFSDGPLKISDILKTSILPQNFPQMEDWAPNVAIFQRRFSRQQFSDGVWTKGHQAGF